MYTSGMALPGRAAAGRRGESTPKYAMLSSATLGLENGVQATQHRRVFRTPRLTRESGAESQSRQGKCGPLDEIRLRR